VLFSDDVDAETLGDRPLVVTEVPGGQPLGGPSSLAADRRTVVFHPSTIRAGASYSLTISPDLRSAAGGVVGPGSDAGDPSFPVAYETFAQPPTLPPGLELVEATTSSLRLQWNAATDNASADGSELDYLVYAAPTPSPIDFDGAPASTTDPGVTTAVISRLEPGTEYRAAVRARDPAGNLSTPSEEVIARTVSAEDHEPPTSPGAVAIEVDPAAPRALTVRWEPAKDRPDPTAPVLYNVYVALESGAQDFNLPAMTTAAGATEASVENLEPDTEYFVVVRAMDTTGNEEDNRVEAPAPRRTPVSYAANVQKILTLPDGYDPSLCWPTCTNYVQPGGCARVTCHTGARPAGGLDLRTYETTVGSRAVVPGSSDRSLLILRMQSTNSGVRMPRGGTCNLESGCIDAIARWIDQGAINN
jgi:chitodextrinase